MLFGDSILPVLFGGCYFFDFEMSLEYPAKFIRLDWIDERFSVENLDLYNLLISPLNVKPPCCPELVI